jgi:hypothetical protein
MPFAAIRIRSGGTKATAVQNGHFYLSRPEATAGEYKRVRASEMLEDLSFLRRCRGERATRVPRNRKVP